jgi:hypothetical protein
MQFMLATRSPDFLMSNFIYFVFKPYPANVEYTVKS